MFPCGCAVVSMCLNRGVPPWLAFLMFQLSVSTNSYRALPAQEFITVHLCSVLFMFFLKKNVLKKGVYGKLTFKKKFIKNRIFARLVELKSTCTRMSRIWSKFDKPRIKILLKTV